MAKFTTLCENYEVQLKICSTNVDGKLKNFVLTVNIYNQTDELHGIMVRENRSKI